MHQSTLLEDRLNFLDINLSIALPSQAEGACLGCPGEGGELLLGAEHLSFLMDTQLGDLVLSSEWLPQAQDRRTGSIRPQWMDSKAGESGGLPAKSH